MTYQTLISPSELVPFLGHPDWAIFDCSYIQESPDRGFENYCRDHLPGALYADLLRDLCSEPVPGKTSRHPFPDPDAFAVKLSKWGIDENVQVVVYDDIDCGFAVRLWRMLGWMGHRNVALLDGGFNNWAEHGLPLESGEKHRPFRKFKPQLQPELLISSEEVAQIYSNPAYVLIDTRSSRSYTGAKDPLSPTSGHIPGAVHFQYTQNLGQDGCLLPIPSIIERYQSILKEKKPIAYCTSGVTASLNILALQHAGLGEARLYAGSWDEWIIDPARPVEKTLPTSVP